MRLQFLLFFVAAVGGCNTSSPEVGAPREDCEDVAARIDPVKGLKPSPALELAEKMACQYGRFVTRTEWNCSLHVHAPIYFDNEERYGLKEPTITALLKSEMRGQDIAEDFEENLSKQGLYMQDERECLNGIGDFNERFKTLVDITRRLSSKGY